LRKRLSVAELREIFNSLKEGKSRIKSTIGTKTVVEPAALTKILKQAKVYAKALDRPQVAVDRGRCECNSELSIATKKRRFGIARMLFADQRRDYRRALKAGECIASYFIKTAKARPKGLKCDCRLLLLGTNSILVAMSTRPSTTCVATNSAQFMPPTTADE
jgi:hypothetical protein